jgi:tetratricopeptide (TPR) repeat protein
MTGQGAKRDGGAPPTAADEAAFRALDPELRAAFAAAQANDLALAESRTRAYLANHGEDVNALKLMAEIALRKGDHAEAERLFEACLRLAPDFDEARRRLAAMLVNLSRLKAARGHLEILMRRDPRHPAHRSLMAYALGQVGDYALALPLREGILNEAPGRPTEWMLYANDLRAVGKRAECIDAYRRAIALDPELVDAYWNLSNLKDFRFDPAELDAMRARLSRTELAPRSRAIFHFCLGKAAEDKGLYDEAFANFRKANALMRATMAYDPARASAEMRRLMEFFTPSFFNERAGWGSQARDPIFIVGLPRSGSTLVEQILASHSAIEGTRELPYIQALAAGLRGGFPDGLRALGAEAFAALGERYLEEAGAFRRLDRPRFTDKMPSNFAFAGFIHLVLPNAKIVDVRRNPLDCCLANFKQLFSRAYAFSYSLEDAGSYYRDYVAVMAHFDRVLPGRLCRIEYERLVDDPERETRRLLDYLELPFEPACLAFHKNDRAVRTASSEQVRRPLFRDSIDGWRNYRAHLGPLRRALGDLVEGAP